MDIFRMTETLNVVSHGKTIVLNYQAAKYCDFFSVVIEDDEELEDEYNLPDMFSYDVVEFCIRLLNHFGETKDLEPLNKDGKPVAFVKPLTSRDPVENGVPQWYVDQLNEVSNPFVFDVMEFYNFVSCKPLLELVALFIAAKNVKGYSPDEIFENMLSINGRYIRRNCSDIFNVKTMDEVISFLAKTDTDHEGIDADTAHRFKERFQTVDEFFNFIRNC